MGEDEVPELPLCGGRRVLTDVRGHCGRDPGCIDRDCDLTIKSRGLRMARVRTRYL
jgi:hypothetical protein